MEDARSVAQIPETVNTILSASPVSIGHAPMLGEAPDCGEDTALRDLLPLIPAPGDLGDGDVAVGVARQVLKDHSRCFVEMFCPPRDQLGTGWRQTRCSSVASTCSSMNLC